MKRKNMRRDQQADSAQTAWNLQHLAVMGKMEPGRVVDKLVRNRMVELHGNITKSV